MNMCNSGGGIMCSTNVFAGSSTYNILRRNTVFDSLNTITLGFFILKKTN